MMQAFVDLATPMSFSRREFLGSIAAAASAFAVPALPALAEKRPARAPNIIFFLTDDQRNDTLGCTGDKIVMTPHIDALAAQGTLFRNAFVTTSICPSSRASILTGVTETRHHYTFGTPPIARALCDTSYPALLKKAGYRTAIIGKFGVEMADDAQKGFVDDFDPRDRPYDRKRADGTPVHVDQLNLESALSFIEQADADQPFLLSLNFSSAHAEDDDKQRQYHPLPWAEDLYTDVQFPPPKLGDPRYFESQPDFLKHSFNRVRFGWRWDTPEKYQKNMRDYYRMLSGIDHMIGIVMDALRSRGLLENSIVVYAADNGYYMGDRGFADKWTHYEESMRVPIIIADQRTTHRKPRVVDAIALNVDIPATFLDAAGIAQPATYQGRSLLPMTRGDTPHDWRKDFLCQHTMNEPGIPKWVGVRGERYMYARYYEQSPAYEFLHDLKADPTEFVNLATSDKHAKLLAEQRAHCDALRQTMA